MSVGEAPICIALDRATTADNLALIAALGGQVGWYKVGLRQFYADADPVIDAVRASGARLFLDLKLHDIPATVAGAVASLSRYRPDLLTIHASGGSEMIAAAVEAAGAQTRILAVTVLTSLSSEDAAALGWAGAPSAMVARWADVAMAAGAHGLVCSGHEVGALRSSLGGAPWLVTPGIRPAGGERGDQKRVTTPAAALAAGASLLVVGRPIHGAADPAAAYAALAEGCERA